MAIHGAGMLQSMDGSAGTGYDVGQAGAVGVVASGQMASMVQLVVHLILLHLLVILAAVPTATRFRPSRRSLHRLDLLLSWFPLVLETCTNFAITADRKQLPSIDSSSTIHQNSAAN